MKIALVNDQHFGCRNDSIHFDNFFEKFYRDVFFPYLDKHDIKCIFDLGDTFDRRKYINFVSLKRCKEYWFNEIKKRNIPLHVLVGNHTTVYKNTNEFNSPELLLAEYDNVQIYKEAKDIEIDGALIGIVPWINPTNEKQTLKYLSDTKAEVLFGHFEIAGFEMDKGSVCHEGMDRTIFDRFDLVLSGHFHHKSTDGIIYYLGNQYEITWADYNDPRGFHIYDTDTRELTFVENPYKIFYKLDYDDSIQSFETWKQFDFSKYKDVYLKINVKNKQNPYLFDTILDKILKENPIDVSVVENFDDFQVPESEEIDQAEDTVTILSKYIDQLTLNVESERMKILMRDLYQECLSVNNNVD